MMKNIQLLLCLSLIFNYSIGQTTKKVLFLGNSYTSVNNLPALISNLAISKGNNLVYDSNTPGGHRFLNHAVNQTSLAKITSDNWDYVVLQAQSQEGAFPDGQLDTEVYPYAEILNDSVKANNPCSESMFYMTWGRENGDQQNCQFYPPFCTYNGMQERLRYAYLNMANDNDASVAPVGVAWRYVRENHPSIDLYTADESHPSIYGSYLAACVFYTSIFREAISGSTYYASISQTDAEILQDVASMIVLDSMNTWNIGAYDLQADFSYTINGSEVNFTNTSSNMGNSYWDFGDGNSSNLSSPTHQYGSISSFNVMLVEDDGCKQDTTYQTIDLNTTGLVENKGDLILTQTESNLKLISLKSYTSFEIYALNGKKVLIGKMNSDQINIESLDKGVYVLRLISGAEFLTKKFMK